MLAPRWVHSPFVGWLPQLKPLQQRVLMLLWSFGRVDLHISLVWPSARTMAAALGSNPTRVRQAVRDLEISGALARVSGDFSYVATRSTLKVKRKTIALIAHPGSRAHTKAAQRVPTLNEKALRNRTPTEQKGTTKPYPEQPITFNNLIKNRSSSSIVDSRVAALSAQKKNDNDDNFLILDLVDGVDGAIPWADTITEFQRVRLDSLAKKHGPENLARALVAVRRDLVRKEKPRLSGPAMLEPDAWGKVWTHHAKIMARAMKPTHSARVPVQDVQPPPDLAASDAKSLLDSLLTSEKP